ncbi:MAG TPA: hypothetical protein VKT77_10680 [Chthonomonadaceae bacterium]|nr:hypothetical protein [Chthonomonadaceae bacterium]
MRVGAITLLLLVIPIFIIAFAVGIRMAMPGAIAGWKAQGLLEPPAAWQIGSDFSEFVLHRWFFWLPLYAAVSVTVRSRLAR